MPPGTALMSAGGSRRVRAPVRRCRAQPGLRSGGSVVFELQQDEDGAGDPGDGRGVEADPAQCLEGDFSAKRAYGRPQRRAPWRFTGISGCELCPASVSTSSPFNARREHTGSRSFRDDGRSSAAWGASSTPISGPSGCGVRRPRSSGRRRTAGGRRRSCRGGRPSAGRRCRGGCGRWRRRSRPGGGCRRCRGGRRAGR